MSTEPGTEPKVGDKVVAAAVDALATYDESVWHKPVDREALAEYRATVRLSVPAALRAAANEWLARDIHDDLCDYGPPGTCPCSLGEVYRWLHDRADEVARATCERVGEVSDGPR